MRTVPGATLIAILAPATAAGQNPFELTGGSVKSAHIVYEVSSKQTPTDGINYQAGATIYEVGVTPDRWIMRMVAPFEMAGKRDTMRTVVAASGDSQYTYLSM